MSRFLFHSSHQSKGYLLPTSPSPLGSLHPSGLTAFSQGSCPGACPGECNASLHPYIHFSICLCLFLQTTNLQKLAVSKSSLCTQTFTQGSDAHLC